MTKHPSIFVMVRTPARSEAGQIVREIFTKSAFPERVYVATGPKPQILEHAHQKLRAIKSHIRCLEENNSKVKSIEVLVKDLPKLWAGEDYLLIIDKPVELEDGWDEILISMLKRCSGNKNIISINPEYFSGKDGFGKNDVVITAIDGISSQGNLIPKGIGVHRDKLGHTLPRGVVCSTSFMFSMSALLEAVPIDPDMPSDYEDTAFSVRLWTHGWNIYHPDEPVVIASRHKHQGGRKKDKNLRSPALFQQIIGRMDSSEYHGKYGNGKTRNLNSLGIAMGVDFAAGTVEDRAKSGGFIFTESVFGKQGIEKLKNKLARTEANANIPIEPVKVVETPDMVVFDNFLSDDLLENLRIYLGNIPMIIPIENGIIPNWFNVKDGLPLKRNITFTFNAKLKNDEVKNAPPSENVDETYTSPVMLKLASKINKVAEEVENVVGKVKSDWTKLTVEHSAYRVGCGKTFDTSEYVNHFSSYELCITDDWKFNWGAGLMADTGYAEIKKRDIFSRKGFIEPNSGIWIHPKPNRMIFFSKRCSHAITKVTDNAGDNMIEFISGIFR